MNHLKNCFPLHTYTIRIFKYLNSILIAAVKK